MNKTKHFDIMVDVQGGPTLVWFSIGIHSHSKHDTEACDFRWGVFLIIMNLRLSVGIFNVVM